MQKLDVNLRFRQKTAAEKAAEKAEKEASEMQKTEQIETIKAVVEQPKKARKPVSEFRKLTSKLDLKVKNREKNLAKIEQLKKSVEADQLAIDSFLKEINALQNKP